MRYALIGESIPGGRAVKILRLAAFAATQNPSLDFSIRVYMVEDTKDALEVTTALMESNKGEISILELIKISDKSHDCIQKLCILSC